MLWHMFESLILYFFIKVWHLFHLEREKKRNKRNTYKYVCVIIEKYMNFFNEYYKINILIKKNILFPVEIAEETKGKTNDNCLRQSNLFIGVCLANISNNHCRITCKVEGAISGACIENLCYCQIC